MAASGKAESLGAGYFWIGSNTSAESLRHNPYLLVDGDEAVLFDPGSMSDLEEVVANLASVVAPEKVKYVVLHHQGQGLASVIARLESLGLRFTVATHWRTWSLARFTGIDANSYLVDEHGYRLKLATGRILQFIATPYPHFPGAIATYDKKARFLLSGELFGAFTPSWSLYAKDGYRDGMKAFSERYLPSPEAVKPALELFSCLDLAAILPQHGSIINEHIKDFIDALMNPESGNAQVRASVPINASDEYRIPAERLFERFSAIFGEKQAEAAALKLGIGIDRDSGRFLETAMTGSQLWNRLAETFYLFKGSAALAVLEPFVANLCGEFGIQRPDIYASVLEETQRNFETLGEEVAKLKQENEQLSRASEGSNDAQARDAVTGLYNEAFFRDFIDEQASLTLESEGVEDDILAVVGIDEGMARIEYQYGPREVEAILKGVARVLLENKTANQVAFRLHGATFALWMPRIVFHESNDLCEHIRKSVEISKSFIEPVTISVGLVAIAEIKESLEDPAEAGSTLSEIGIRRLRLARKRGGNTICSSSEVGKEIETKANILIVDDDRVNAGVIRTFLENADYKVDIAEDGDQAVKKVGKEGFDLIISELMIPKIDGFMLKEALSRKSGTKDIPFVLLSHLKDERTVIRAYSLGIDHYLQKPYLLAELLGIVQNMTSTAGAGR